MIESDNRRREFEEQPQEEAHVNFQPKAQSPAISEEDQAAITFVNQLKTQFAKDEFDNLLIILQALADDKGQIEIVLKSVKH